MRLRKFSELEAKMSPESRAYVKQKVENGLAAIDLQNILCERGITQEELASQMEIGQSNVSRMLRRTNMNVNTLQDAIEAMGGKLEIIAHFPDKDYRIDQFASA